MYFFFKDMAVSQTWKLLNQRTLTEEPTITEVGKIQQVEGESGLETC